VAKEQEVSKLKGSGIPVNCVAFAPDNSQVAVGFAKSGAGAVKIYDLASGDLRFDSGNKNQIYQVQFSPDGNFLAALGYESTIFVWDVKTSTAAHDGVLCLWDHQTGKTAHEWKFPGGVRHIAWAPDARHFTVSNANGTMFLMRFAKKLAP
jgi:WD40 repeat protein